MRIAGEKRQREPAATGPAAEGTDPAAAARRGRMWIILGTVAVLLIGLSASVAYVVTRASNANVGASLVMAAEDEDGGHGQGFEGH